MLKTKPADRIASVGSAARLLVDAGGDDNKALAVKVVIIAVLDRGDQRRERHAIMHVGRDRSGARPIVVDQHEFAIHVQRGKRVEDRSHAGRRVDRAVARRDDDAEQDASLMLLPLVELHLTVRQMRHLEL